MRVCGVQNNNYQNYQKPVKFTGNFATVYAENGRDILYKKYTASFREPFDWEKCPKFLYEWFKDAMSVIFANHACSSGEETWSFKASLIDKLGEKIANKFKMYGFDFDQENIVAARSGKFKAYADEIYRMKKYLKNPEKYFEFGKNYNKIEPAPVCNHLENTVDVTVKPILSDNVTFYKSDIYKDIDHFPNENLVLPLRNFWLWQKPEQREYLVNKMANKFKGTKSLVGIGNCDMLATDIHDLLLKKGFEETEIQYFYAMRKRLYSMVN